MSILPGLWEMHGHLMINGHSDYEHWDKTYLDRFADEIMPASAHQLLLAGVVLMIGTDSQIFEAITGLRPK